MTVKRQYSIIQHLARNSDDVAYSWYDTYWSALFTKR